MKNKRVPYKAVVILIFSSELLPLAVTILLQAVVPSVRLRAASLTIITSVNPVSVELLSDAIADSGVSFAVAEKAYK
jgi:hypothetical protein